MDQNATDLNALPAAPAPAAPVVAPSAPSPAPGPDPAYVAQLEAAYREQQVQLNRFEPIKDVAEWMLEDESRVGGIKTYREALERSSKPEIPEPLRDLYKHIDERTEPVRAYITRQEQAEQRTQTEQRQKFERENMQFAARLAGEQKYDQAKMLEIAAFADSMATRLQRNVGIEEAYKSLTSFGGSKTPEGDAPILRGDSGAIGVPGQSTHDDKSYLTDFHGWTVNAIEKARKAS